MIWSSPRLVPSRCSRIRRFSKTLCQYPRLLPCLSKEVIFLAKSREYSTKIQEQDNEQLKVIHDVASVLSIASEESVPVRVLSTIRTIRRQKKHTFAKLGDGSTTSELQVLLSSSQAEGLSTGTSVEISGTLQPSPQGLQQSHELHADEVTVIGSTESETYPIQKKYHTPEFLRTIPHLRLRTPWNGLLTRLRSEVEHSCSEWLYQNGAIRIHPPIITSSDCEGAGEVFNISPAIIEDEASDNGHHYFRGPKYLTVSSQLHLEAYMHTHRLVWALSPTFRAERSDTPRHLSEFYMLEVEVQTTSLCKVIDIAESILRHVATELLSSPLGSEILTYTELHPLRDTKSTNENQPLKQRWQSLASSTPYPRTTYTQAIKHLQSVSNTFTQKPEWGSSLALEHEKYLAQTINGGQTPIFITDYPTAIKPFYMLPSPLSQSEDETRETVSSFDILLPSIAEVAGGSLREHRYDALLAAMQAKHVSSERLEWYLALRRYGSIPHGGFGLGFDRLLCYLSGESSVRDVVAWPRWVGRCDG